MQVKVRASGAGRWVPCPASPRLEAGRPFAPSFEQEWGIEAHAAVADRLKGIPRSELDDPAMEDVEDNSG